MLCAGLYSVQLLIELTSWVDVTCSCNLVGNVAGRSGSMLYPGRCIVSGFALASPLYLDVAMLSGVCLRLLDRTSCGGKRLWFSWSVGAPRGVVILIVIVIVAALMACSMHWFVSEENLVLGALQPGGIWYLGGLVDLSLYNKLFSNS